MGVDAARFVEYAHSGETEIENLLSSLRRDPAREKEEGLSVAHPIGQLLSLPAENRRQSCGGDIDVVDRGGNRVDGGGLHGEREFRSRRIDHRSAPRRDLEHPLSLVFTARDAPLFHAEVSGSNPQNSKWNDEQYARDPDPSERDLGARRSHGRSSSPGGASAITRSGRESPIFCASVASRVGSRNSATRAVRMRCSSSRACKRSTAL